MSQRKHLPISRHQTLNGILEVNWLQDYQGEFTCPQCNQGRLTKAYFAHGSINGVRLECNSCGQYTYLSCTSQRKHLPISRHQTLNGILEVDWLQDYQGEFTCPQCNQGRLTKAYFAHGSVNGVRLGCNSCGQYTFLSCENPAYIYNYQADLECPNPLCTGIGPRGQRGWIYKCNDLGYGRCRYCKIIFEPSATVQYNWQGRQKLQELLPFDFAANTWDLRHFYEKPYYRLLTFDGIEPDWFCLQAKQYLHYLLKAQVYSSTSQIRAIRAVLGQLGEVLKQRKCSSLQDIKRSDILNLIDAWQSIKGRTVYTKLYQLKEFLSWAGLEAEALVKRRDFPKIRHDDPVWLDEPTRSAIKSHLHKLPEPLARHYLVQEYTAARPGDVCQMQFDCLVAENSKWYIRFFQQKTKRWHQIPANREIRRIIEAQQAWIRQTLGPDYNYLFCHFRVFKKGSYPKFSRIKPLPEPPKTNADVNPMVRAIRYLIEAEDIRDSNGQQPHFTGRITRSSRLQEIRVKHGIEAAQLYADHVSSTTTFQHYAPPTREQVATADLPFQELLLNPDNKFLPWQSLPESLLKNPKAHELDIEINPRLTVYGHCALDPKTPCPHNLYPKCYGCSSFRPSTGKLPLYERQYQSEVQRMEQAKTAGAELVYEEAKATVEAMKQWLPQLREVANG
jgi:transcription elongation factor Elf1/integrase